MSQRPSKRPRQVRQSSRALPACHPFLCSMRDLPQFLNMSPSTGYISNACSAADSRVMAHGPHPRVAGSAPVRLHLFSTLFLVLSSSPSSKSCHMLQNFIVPAVVPPFFQTPRWFFPYDLFHPCTGFSHHLDRHSTTFVDSMHECDHYAALYIEW